MINDNIQLHTLLGDIVVPRNYRWELKHEDNVLMLRVQKCEMFPLFGRQFRRPWETIREMTAPTYGAMLRQLQEWPEFLEFYRASDEPVRRMATSSI
jgi:hypothetical protein